MGQLGRSAPPIIDSDFIVSSTLQLGIFPSLGLGKATHLKQMH
jgi:hypothetical protein